MKKLKALLNNYIFNLALILLFTGIVLFFTLNKNLEKVIEVLKGTNLGLVALIIVATMVYQIILGGIIKVLVSIFNPQYSLAKGTINALIGTLFRGITPARGGGQVAQVYLFNKQGVKMTDSLSILLMDLVIYQIVCVLFGLVLLILKFSYFLESYSAVLWLVILGWIDDSILMVLVFGLSKSPRLHHWVSNHGINLLSKLHIIRDKQKTLDKLDENINNFQIAWKTITRHKSHMMWAIVLNVLRLVVYFSLPVFTVLALGYPLDWDTAFNIFVLTAFVSMMNSLIPIPGSAGTTEAAFIYFVTPAIGYITAVSSALVWRFATFHFVLVIGALTFMLVKRYYLKKGEA